jgi:2-C-methyl-D-erythritol 4-phosphate cytidylyltransferase/2-C-methyl-D-erythritol 2,4-cyclodiphosphate synthase
MTPDTKELWAVLLAAGQGSRLRKAGLTTGKQYLQWRGAPLFWSSAATFARIPAVKGVVFVFPPDELPDREELVRELARERDFPLPFCVAAGGARRQDSVRNGLDALPDSCGRVLVHDAARPFAKPAMIQRLIDSLQAGDPGAVPAMPVKDTIKRLDGDVVAETLKRGELAAVQTPQAFDRDPLQRAHRLAMEQDWDVTDDASMLERMGLAVRAVPGEEDNVKITTPADLDMLREQASSETCAGHGYDVHRYGPGRPMVLGGVPIPEGPEVVAHSDGDVLLHALMDALLGAAGLGDIGLHFPDSDPAYAGAPSAALLQEVLDRLAREGVAPVHVDMTIIAQVPKIAPWREKIRANAAAVLQMPERCVNLKATTEEGLGFTGEKLGIKAMATALCQRRPGGQQESD